METQTCFDLTIAIENWRQELAAQPDLTPDVRRELETHLRDTVAELQRRGLNGEESFWLTRRRVGQPKQLGEEFKRSDPLRVWRERVLWMVIALLAINIWGTVTAILLSFFPISTIETGAIGTMHNYLPESMTSWLPSALNDFLNGLVGSFNLRNWLRPMINLLPFVMAAILIYQGKMIKSSLAMRVWNFLSCSRLRFVFVVLSSSLGLQLLLHSLEMRHFSSGMQGHLSRGFSAVMVRWTFFPNMIGPSMLVILAAFLIPTQNRKHPNRA